MITSLTLHDHTLVDQLSSVAITQPVDAETNESNIENKICNIKTKVSHLIGNIPSYFYKGTKGAVKYTYKTINAHSKISISMLILSFVAYAVLVTYNYKLCRTGEAGNPIITAFTFTIALLLSLVGSALTVHNYKSLKSHKASRQKITGSIVLIVAIASVLILSVARLAAYVAFPYYNYKVC